MAVHIPYPRCRASSPLPLALPAPQAPWAVAGSVRVSLCTWVRGVCVCDSHRLLSPPTHPRDRAPRLRRFLQTFIYCAPVKLQNKCSRHKRRGRRPSRVDPNLTASVHCVSAWAREGSWGVPASPAPTPPRAGARGRGGFQLLVLVAPLGEAGGEACMPASGQAWQPSPPLPDWSAFSPTPTPQPASLQTLNPVGWCQGRDGREGVSGSGLCAGRGAGRAAGSRWPGKR